jgi:2-polyprenyl-6-methoxyphenol hydroxylase-like FAD-dependent oxidoreductase
MEDGMTLAITLALAGKTRVPDAVRAYEKIRYERVRRAQKTGETTRDMWHQADFEKIMENPEKLSLPREAWLLGHDAEAHAYEVGPAVLEELRKSGSRATL